MDRKFKSKLLKNVLKQAESMRAPFRGSAYPNKSSQIDKKSSFLNKTGEKFRSKLIKLSVDQSWTIIKKEWIIIKQVQLEKQSEQCLCGRKNLKYITYLKNKINNNEITAGNCCLLTLFP